MRTSIEAVSKPFDESILVPPMSGTKMIKPNEERGFEISSKQYDRLLPKSLFA